MTADGTASHATIAAGYATYWCAAETTSAGSYRYATTCPSP
jgi:hypothetical protein